MYNRWISTIRAAECPRHHRRRSSSNQQQSNRKTTGGGGGGGTKSSRPSRLTARIRWTRKPSPFWRPARISRERPNPGKTSWLFWAIFYGRSGNARRWEVQQRRFHFYLFFFFFTLVRSGKVHGRLFHESLLKVTVEQLVVKVKKIISGQEDRLHGAVPL